MNKAANFGFETQKRHHPAKRTYVLQKFKNKNLSQSAYINTADTVSFTFNSDK